MDVEAIAQLVTFLVAALAIIWHQQHNTDKLREELNDSNRQLREGITENGQRLARIEGFLGIGMPAVPDESVDAGPK
ncbi:MAG: hypothetical protein OXN44_06890 [Acidimicrobiaceae bacterium]|nr:hypothetical protein [Acidimicrobiaceae bacterium]MDE0606102.1 hypothetical protein [Acidimicrobiaceae bacterium]